MFLLKISKKFDDILDKFSLNAFLSFSFFFDYSIMSKPMFTFCYDYDRYVSERGMYFDIRDWLPSAKNEDELLNLIKLDKLDVLLEKTRKFQQKFVTSYGSAVKQSLNVLNNVLSGA